MNLNYAKIAAILAWIIGGMAVFAGGGVLLGRDPGYYVINWLPIYNFALGVITVGFTAIAVWKNHPTAWPAAWATCGAHVLVLLILLFGYRPVVAPDSLTAMTVRIVAWLMILGLMGVQGRKSAQTAPGRKPAA